MAESAEKYWMLGLVGYPLGHSLSPSLHTAALDSLGMRGEYNLVSIPPEEKSELLAFLDRMRAGALHGLNLTIPHKQSVLRYLDKLTPTAAAIGAVNTIYLQGEQLVGDNTDAPGFTSDLARQTGWELGTEVPDRHIHRSALVLGAGGSARAVVYALSSLGWRIRVSARRPEQAQNLIADLESVTSSVITYLPWYELGSGSHSKTDLLVNCTPVGMAPQELVSPWPEGSDLPPGTFVYDLVYNPAETSLLRRARSAGLRAANGLGMLVEQAALAFERWTGQPAPLQAMWDAVEQVKPEETA